MIKLYLIAFTLGLLGSGLFSLGSIWSANKHSAMVNFLFVAGSTTGTFIGMLIGGWFKK